MYCIILPAALPLARKASPSTQPHAHLANMLQSKAQRVPINVGAAALLLSRQLSGADQPLLLPLPRGSQSAGEGWREAGVKSLAQGASNDRQICNDCKSGTMRQGNAGEATFACWQRQFSLQFSLSAPGNSGGCRWYSPCGSTRWLLQSRRGPAKMCGKKSVMAHPARAGAHEKLGASAVPRAYRCGCRHSCRLCAARLIVRSVQLSPPWKRTGPRCQENASEPKSEKTDRALLLRSSCDRHSKPFRTSWTWRQAGTALSACHPAFWALIVPLQHFIASIASNPS